MNIEFYEKIGNWDFSMIKYHEEILENGFDYWKLLNEFIKEESVCLDLRYRWRRKTS